MRKQIDIPESHRDLLQSTILAQVAFRLPDGLLANNVVSFLWDGESVGFSTLKAYYKYRCLQADSALTILLIDPDDPRRYLELLGQAELGDDVDNQYIDSIAKKYFGLEKYPYHKAGDQRVTVKLKLQQCRALMLDH